MTDIEKNILIQALDHLPVGALLVDARSPDWCIAWANPATGQLTGGLEVAELVGRPWRSLLADPAELDAQRERLTGNSSLVVRQLRQRWVSRAGNPVDLDLQVTPLFAGPAQVAYWLVTLETPAFSGDDADGDSLRDALRDAQLRLQQQDWNDSATGLLSRRAFTQLVQRDWMIARREERRLTVLVLHLDAFDRYRELYGKHAADSCLRKVSHAITGAMRRAGDAAGRIADDRFAMLIGPAEESQAAEFAAQIARKVRELAIHHPRSPGGRFLTVSWGIGSEVPSRKGSTCSLIKRAEAEIGRPAEAAGDREVG